YRFSATYGSGPPAVTCLIPDTNLLPEHWANTMENSCVTRWCCAEAHALLLARTSGPLTEISSRRRRAGNSPGSGSRMTAYNSPAVVLSPIAEEVLQGLRATPKRLPPKLFYDAEGSHLFEQITELPEYYPTRTERALFEAYAGEIVAQAGNNLTLIELGAGSASKTRILIEALAARQLRVGFYPIDVSVAALKQAVTGLNG